MTQDMIHQSIGTDDLDGEELETAAGSVTRDRISVDSSDGTETEVVDLDPVAGASSEAPVSSGIPSAIIQQDNQTPDDRTPKLSPTDESPMADRTIPMHQDTKP